ncbi:MAG: hypothetical protein LBQ09_09935, partial [Acidobacteriaceae bacterium]|nr:hypothetical protein [Acidobacteriaceae bacterium]
MQYPALDITGADTDLLLALVDDFSPSAVSEEPPTVTVYYGSTDARDSAREAVLRAYPAATVT